MDPSDYYNEAMVSEPMEVVAGVSEAEGASTLEGAAGGQGGDVLGRIGGPVVAVLEKNQSSAPWQGPSGLSWARCW